MDKQEVDWSLYLITDRRISGERSIVDIVQAAIYGGATVIQLREKNASTREMIDLGRQLHAVTQKAGIPLIINDRLDVALAVEAEGVHVGPPDDMPAPIARRLLGPDRILGVSAESPEIALQAAEDGADYIGVGDVYGTASKPDAGLPIGLEGLKNVVKASPIPAVGIGGIHLDNAGAVIKAGAMGVAVISAIIEADNPEAAASALRKRIDRARR